MTHCDYSAEQIMQIVHHPHNYYLHGNTKVYQECSGNTNIGAVEGKEGDGKDFQKCLIKAMLYIVQ